MTSAIIFCAQYLFLVPIAIVALTVVKLPPSERRVLALRAIVVLLLGTLLAKLGGMIYNDPRPFVVLHTHPLIPHAPDNGFPSDHSLVVFACMFLLLPFSIRAAVVAGILATVVAMARVACQLHTPLDVVASIVFAGISNLVVWKTVKN